MLAATWSLRPDGHTLDSYKEYCNHPTAFTLKHQPWEQTMVKDLGYIHTDLMLYYKIPKLPLHNGLKSLACDKDVMEMCQYVSQCKRPIVIEDDDGSDSSEYSGDSEDSDIETLILEMRTLMEMTLSIRSRLLLVLDPIIGIYPLAYAVVEVDTKNHVMVLELRDSHVPTKWGPTAQPKILQGQRTSRSHAPPQAFTSSSQATQAPPSSSKIHKHHITTKLHKSSQDSPSLHCNPRKKNGSNAKEAVVM
ncbi:hypothetical protein Tco_0661894 [Tanacetum coccineum]